MGNNHSNFFGFSGDDPLMDVDEINIENESEDEDYDLATILQILIRSGQVHIVSYDEGVRRSNNGLHNVKLPPRNKRKLNTKMLDKSEVSIETKRACGLSIVDDVNTKVCITDLISKRQHGLTKTGCQFSKQEKCQISNIFLPNTMKVADQTHSKFFCGMYSKDGNRFLSAAQHSDLRIYDTNTPNFKIIKEYRGQNVGWSIIDTAFSPCGKYILYSSWSDNLYLCHLESEQETHKALPMFPDNHRFCIFSLMFSNNGQEFLGGASDCNIYVYDMEANTRSLKFHGHEGDINTVTFADETSQILFSGGDDGFCKVWDRRCLNEENPEPVGILAGHKDGITFIDSRNDGRHLISNSKDQTIKLWDIRVFSDEKGQNSTRKAVNNQSWDYRWQAVPQSLFSNISRLDGDTSVMTYRGHTVQKTLIRCRFSPVHTTGQRFIYTGCAGGRIIIYDMLSGQIVQELKNGHTGCVRDVHWHPYRSEIISSSWDTTLGKWTFQSSDERDERETKNSHCRLRRSTRIKERQERERENSHND
uniref:Putative wd40 domain protein n=1 Tax=Xenopsylla cheopis TaxID=163159 RepID=A0A6M2DRD1_XENCH